MTATRLARSLLTATAGRDEVLTDRLIWEATQLGEYGTWDAVEHLAVIAGALLDLIDAMRPGAAEVALAAVCRRAAVMEAESELTGEGWS